MATDSQPCMILLDGQLPDMSGAAVIQSVKGDAGTRNIPIVIVSGRPASVPDETVAAHLLKPIDIADLCRVVRKLLDDIDES